LRALFHSSSKVLGLKKFDKIIEKYGNVCAKLQYATGQENVGGGEIK